MNHNFKRAAALGLTACLLISSAQASVFLGGYRYFYPIAPDTTFSHTDGQTANGGQRQNVITYQPSDTVEIMGVRAGDPLFGSKDTLSQAIDRLEAQGKNVIAGINADFFSTEEGISTGAIIDNGRILACNTWQSAVGFTDKGEAVISQPVTSISLVGESGRVGVYGYNKTRTKVGLYLLDDYYYPETRFSSEGQSIILEYSDKENLSIGTPATLTVVGKVDGNTSIPIGENQMILTRRGDCTSTWVDFPVGEELTLTFHTQDARWSDVDWALGGKTLVTDGKVTTDNIDQGSSQTARTAIGVKADGTVILSQYDGKTDTSKGLTAQQLGDQMVTLGATTALCLDGGGSSTFAVQTPSNTTANTISTSADGYERKVSNYIMLVNNAPSNGTPELLHLTPTYRYLLPNAQTKLSVTALDSAYAIVETVKDADFKVSSGTVANNTFTAGSQTGEITVTATDGAVTGEMQLFVVKDLTDIAITRDGKAITSLVLESGASVDLSAFPTRAGISVASVDDAFTWSVTGDIGTVNDKGVFTAGSRGEGTLTASYNGTSCSISVSVGRSVAQNGLLLADFESSNPFTASNSCKLVPTNSSSAVASGNYAMGVMHNGYADLALTNMVDISKYHTLSLWAMGEGDLYAVYIDAGGSRMAVPIATMTDTLQYVTVELPDDASMLVGLQADGGTAFALDHIFIGEFTPDSTDYPTISLEDAPTAASGDITLQAQISMEQDSFPVRAEQVSVTLDGEALTADYNAGTGDLSIPLTGLSDGLHSVVITALNDAGNRSRAVHHVTIGAVDTPHFADTASHWAMGYIDQLSDRGIMNGVKEGDAYYYYPDRNLTRAEFATIMARAMGLDTSATSVSVYADAASIPSWAVGSVMAVSKAGLMSGASSGNQLYFNPSAQITRAEVMTVLSRSLPRGYASAPLTFTDASAVPSWATEHVQYATAIGLVGGYPDGTLLPNGKITRAEIAVIFCRL